MEYEVKKDGKTVKYCQTQKEVAELVGRKLSSIQYHFQPSKLNKSETIINGFKIIKV